MIKDDEGAEWLEDEDIVRRLIVDHSAILAIPFTREEVEEVLFQMHPNKASGVDGLPAYSTRSFGVLWVMMWLSPVFKSSMRGPPQR
ncbi:hypothetical protein OROGR_025585 [Orobanche gracilis]